MIEIRNLSVSYGRQPAVTDVSLRVDEGEFVLLTGPSGCGKSTLARCLAGLIPHSSAAQTVRMSGEVRIDGLLTRDHSVPTLATRVGLVFQNPVTQLFSLSVEEEVSFGPHNLGLSPADISERSRFALEATGIVHLRTRSINSLSAGEQQRVAIASVLAMRPKVLVLDEPTSNLDLRGTEAVLRTLERLRHEYGLTVVVIEHRLHDLGRLADRMLIMDAGRIIADDRPSRLFQRKQLLAGLGIRYPWHFMQDDWSALLPHGLTRRQPSAEGSPLIELMGVEAGYGRNLVLRGLDLAIKRGEFVALVGDNGTGKTTVAKVLAGLLRPRRGRVSWEGAARRPRLGRQVGLLLQNPLSQLFCDTVEEEVSFGPRNFDRDFDEALDDILEATGLQTLRARRPYGLSSGQQQRTALAATLALGPDLLILDEPTMGQDWRHLSEFMDFLVRLNEKGTTVLLITHDHKLICRYARRILVLEDGRIVADGAPRVPIALAGQTEWREIGELAELERQASSWGGSS